MVVRSARLLLLLSLLLGLLTSSRVLGFRCIGQVQQTENGRIFCPGNSHTVLTLSPTKPLYSSCVVPNKEWHRVRLSDLQDGYHYSIRLSYIALRTHLIDMKLEAVLRNGSSIITDRNNFDSRVMIFSYPGETSGVGKNSEGSHNSGLKLSRYNSPFGPSLARRASPASLRPPHGSDRELLDTSVKFLNPLHTMEAGFQIEEVILHIRITPEGLPSGELYNEVGVFSECERSSEALPPKKAGGKEAFFEFDMLLTENIVSAVNLEIITIVLICVSFFMVANFYLLKKWHRYITRVTEDTN